MRRGDRIGWIHEYSYINQINLQFEIISCSNLNSYTPLHDLGVVHIFSYNIKGKTKKGEVR